MEIIHWILDKIITVIPGKLLRTLYSPEKIASQVRIRLRGERPIVPLLNSSVPHVDLYLEITNLSNIDLELDRMLIDLWFGQPVLNGAILERKLVTARSDDCQIFFRSFISSLQISQIKSCLDDNPPTGFITLTIHAYFNSKIGKVECECRFERRAVL